MVNEKSDYHASIKELIGISVLDHIIIGRGTYLSFKQEKLL
ncbi:JAB domain-containing protein [Acetobacterium sp.]|jgi:DNA repair protein RadC|nr:JAB domain-containing protein [Acetobacterium sp.]MDO9493682.1 JAB domain-containing protein [Acetobacterium sp.]